MFYMSYLYTNLFVITYLNSIYSQSIYLSHQKNIITTTLAISDSYIISYHII